MDVSRAPMIKKRSLETALTSPQYQSVLPLLRLAIINFIHLNIGVVIVQGLFVLLGGVASDFLRVSPSFL